MPIDYDHLAERLATLKTNRRRFGVGAAGAVASLSGAAVLATRALGNESARPIQPSRPSPLEDQPPTAVAGVPNVPNAAPTVIRSALQAAVPNGMALVSSPRLPLFDLASQDVGALVGGQIPSWIEVGSALDLAVAPVAINGVTMDGLAAGQTFADYEELAGFLNSADGYGGVALVPADQVDARVNVLAVDGFDPVRNGQFDEPTMRIGFVGDIVPGRNVGIKMREYNDYTHPFHRVAAILSSYDLTIANLEGDLSDDIPVPTEGATFDFVASTADDRRPRDGRNRRGEPGQQPQHLEQRRLGYAGPDRHDRCPRCPLLRTFRRRPHHSMRRARPTPRPSPASRSRSSASTA